MNYKKNSQQLHFDQILDEYRSAYHSRGSNHYKHKLIYSKIVPLIREKWPNGCQILEVACGSGENSFQLRELLGDNYKFSGTDISGESVAAFNQIMGSQSAQVKNFMDAEDSWSSQFEVVLIIGGLHHMVDGLDTVFKNINSATKPRGILLFVEPNARFLDVVRRWWYRRDGFFEEDHESALDERFLFSKYGVGWNQVHVSYFGFVGFFVILQSMVLRTPKFLQHVLFRPLTRLDVFCSTFFPQSCLAAYICSWEKQS